MRSLNLNSYAKLNLYLEVLGKRSDKYHSIFTLFERVNLFDQIKLKPLAKGKIRIVSSGFSLPTGCNNLAYQAASLLQRDFQINEGVEINIRKHIPVSAGLGGGSSNAAVVLAGLNQFWKLNLGLKHLVNLARKIGSDVPFFLYNSSFACATSRGDKIEVLRLPVKLWHIIVVPRIKVISSLIYKRWDQANKSVLGIVSPFQQGSIGIEKERAGLTTRQSMIKIFKSALLEKDFLKLSTLLFNSLEEVSASIYPVIRKVESFLSDLGLQAISMSGSGPAIFGLVSSRKEAYAIARQLKAKSGNRDVFVVKTI